MGGGDPSRPRLEIDPHQQRLTPAAGEVVETEPKTEAGRRTVPLPAPAVTAMREHRKRQAVERLAPGPAWVGDDQVFCKADGRPLHPSALGPALHADADRAGLPRIRVHDLRHSFGRIAVNELGLPVPVVARIMGHADPKITVSIYGHATGDDLARAAAAFAGVFG